MKKKYLILLIIIVVFIPNVNAKFNNESKCLSCNLACLDCVDGPGQKIPETPPSTQTQPTIPNCTGSCSQSESRCVNGKKTISVSCPCGHSDKKIIDCPSTESYACYRLNLGNDVYRYVWSKGTPGNDYQKVTGIDSEEKCVDNDPDLCTVSKMSGSIEEKYTCENSISTDKIKSGASCTVNGSSFYEYSCNENFVINYDPKLKNSVMSLSSSNTGYSLGFEYNITLSSVKSCTGTFYDAKYNNAYQRLKIKYDNATSSEDKAYYKNLIGMLEQYVKDYNDFYDELTEGFDVTESNKTDIKADLILSYRKTSQTDKSNLISSPPISFDVQLVSKNVEKNRRTNDCVNANESNLNVNVTEDYNACYYSCTKNKNNAITNCTNNCNGNKRCIDDCVNNRVLSCKTECNDISTSEKSKDDCSAKNDLEIILVDENKVSSFGVNTVETYHLTAPQTYLDISGNIVKQIYTGDKDDKKGRYIDGGHKFYINDIKKGNDYKLTTVISNLGTNKKSKITNENCKFSVDKNEREKYRIIDVNNPFVNNDRLNSIHNNWKNENFDFTNIINKNTEPLYTFDLSKNDISEIQKDNVKDNSYLGLCEKNNTDSNAVGRICREIYSK